MDVRGVGNLSGANPVRSVSPTAPRSVSGDVGAKGTPNVLAPRDELEISPAARLLQGASESGSIRAERLDQIRRAIAEGTYETPEKMRVAVERLLADAGFDAKRLD
jgi:negative regulator of flagellin synthesis FlgM